MEKKKGWRMGRHGGGGGVKRAGRVRGGNRVDAKWIGKMNDSPRGDPIHMGPQPQRGNKERE